MRKTAYISLSEDGLGELALPDDSLKELVQSYDYYLWYHWGGSTENCDFFVHYGDEKRVKIDLSKQKGEAHES